METLDCTKRGLEWPENDDPARAGRIVEELAAILRDRCGIDLDSSGTRLIFAPDPPKSARPLSWILERLDGNGGEEIHRLDWGKQGLAFVVGTSALFDKAMAAFLAMKSTTLTVLAVVSRSGRELTDAQAARLIECFLDDQPILEGFELGALFFDMGELRNCTCYRT